MASGQQSAPDEEQSLRDCEAYVLRHNIQGILKECIVNLCVSRPENPITFLREYFQKLEKVRFFTSLFSAFAHLISLDLLITSTSS